MHFRLFGTIYAKNNMASWADMVNAGDNGLENGFVFECKIYEDTKFQLSKIENNGHLFFKCFGE